LLKNAGLGDPMDAQSKGGMEHVRFHAVDGVMASIGIEKAMNPYGDVIVAYEMNGEELPRDHGYPLRLIVPGYAGIRNVKWLKKIELSSEEAEGKTCGPRMKRSCHFFIPFWFFSRHRPKTRENVVSVVPYLLIPLTNRIACRYFYSLGWVSGHYRGSHCFLNVNLNTTFR
jgi:DMSO/TMAO reductase YedYZ molybdopterin-dependent catalytic subunit